MSLRKIIQIDESLCNGCGECIGACAEGALELRDGKAKLVRDLYCDGMGACLSGCPTGALTIVEREAEEFDEKAVEARFQPPPNPVHGGCPGSALREMVPRPVHAAGAPVDADSQLAHWPVQLTLVPTAAPFLKDKDILLCADCVPFAMADFHSKLLAGKAVLVACPKLDNMQAYIEKLTALLVDAHPKSVTVARMEVPCCGGLVYALQHAREAAGSKVPISAITVSIRGDVMQEETI